MFMGILIFEKTHFKLGSNTISETGNLFYNLKALEFTATLTLMNMQTLINTCLEEISQYKTKYFDKYHRSIRFIIAIFDHYGRNYIYINIVYAISFLKTLRKHTFISLVIIHLRNSRKFFFSNFLFFYHSSKFFFFVKGNGNFTRYCDLIDINGDHKHN